MNYYNKFIIAPSTKVSLKNFDPQLIDKNETKNTALIKMKKFEQGMHQMQFGLYAEQKRSLLICIQGLDAGGKDGVIRHVIGAMNPQGCRVSSFKEPTSTELAHDFLWRIQSQTPKRGEVVVFNRSHYEDVLVVRVHNLVPEKVWSNRYEQINVFEQVLAQNGTQILKIFLHISKEEQLKRFKKRLDDPTKQWKISESDYTERDYWDQYTKAYEAALGNCSTDYAPWFIIPSDHKWFRDLCISQIINESMVKMNIEFPKPKVNIADIRKKYHETVEQGKALKG